MHIVTRLKTYLGARSAPNHFRAPSKAGGNPEPAACTFRGLQIGVGLGRLRGNFPLGNSLTGPFFGDGDGDGGDANGDRGGT